MTNADIHILPPPKRPPPSPHKWGFERRIPACDSPSRSEQHEWHCTQCPLVKITVMPTGANPRREYRHADGQQFIDVLEPECVAAAAGAEP